MFLFKVVHNTAIPNALAVDWIGKNLYWFDTEKRVIEVSKLNGLYPTILVSKKIKFLRDLSLDPQARYCSLFSKMCVIPNMFISYGAFLLDDKIPRNIGQTP